MVLIHSLILKYSKCFIHHVSFTHIHATLFSTCALSVEQSHTNERIEEHPDLRVQYVAQEMEQSGIKPLTF